MTALALLLLASPMVASPMAAASRARCHRASHGTLSRPRLPARPARSPPRSGQRRPLRRRLSHRDRDRACPGLDPSETYELAPPHSTSPFRTSPARRLTRPLPPHELATEADILSAARTALAGVWTDAEVRVVRLSSAAAAAAPPLRVRFHDAAPRGRASAEVETRVASPTGDGTWTAAGWAYLDVAVFDTAFVLTRDVARGDELASAAEPRRTDVTALPDPLTSLPEGLSAARSLRAGTVLTARHADAPSVVDARAPLRVRYTRGALTVTLACQARERGALGESVRASCPDTRAVYRVRLTGPGEGVWTATLSS